MEVGNARISATLHFPHWVCRRPWEVLRLLVVICVFLDNEANGYQHSRSSKRIIPFQQWTEKLRKGYHRRIAADPTFPTKSATEVLVAAGTQLTAELNQRGAERFLPELDFVLPAILTAVFGKYYSMWRVAKTLKDPENIQTQDSPEGTIIFKNGDDPILFGKFSVPTNAFQAFMMDGINRPTALQRLGSSLVPVLPLFCAGLVCGGVGYGLADLLIRLR